MKRGRSALILLLLAAGLGAYIWFVEMKRDDAANAGAPATTAAEPPKEAKTS